MCKDKQPASENEALQRKKEGRAEPERGRRGSEPSGEVAPFGAQLAKRSHAPELRAFAAESCGPPIPRGIESVATGPQPSGGACREPFGELEPSARGRLRAAALTCDLNSGRSLRSARTFAKTAGLRRRKLRLVALKREPVRQRIAARCAEARPGNVRRRRQAGSEQPAANLPFCRRGRRRTARAVARCAPLNPPKKTKTAPERNTFGGCEPFSDSRYRMSIASP